MIGRTTSSAPRPRPKRRHSFVLATWVALWTAILCALPSGAISASKTLGSAFDPATTSVVLKARSQSLTRQSSIQRTPPAPDIHIPEQRAAIFALAAAPTSSTAISYPPIPPSAPGTRLHGDAQPRAPPRA
ncbi:hypothetical protein [Sphingomonas montanisoli]|uniref:Uncharacterized protein n=1 Tax=Sphingomonas montanisoli TaxID=2606412 RepID=A0A5D9C8R9_9SPHN|nr:hypothetical protein [Sphingomonas montanisoli]TZG27783.1 hypothetical protein FYJ91_09470 [Sphingomonas montanisoli]